MSSAVQPAPSDPVDRQHPDSMEGGPTSPSNPQPLRSRNIGILCSDPQRSEVMDLQRVASAMGARVALVKSDLGQASAPAELEQMARVLAGLYDAVLCLHLPPALVQRLGGTAVIPVVCVTPGEDMGPVLRARLAGICA